MNIIEILKNKPKGTKLYTPMFGECIFDGLENNNIIDTHKETDEYREIESFFSDGTYAMGGECLLFPSKEMRDWKKFSWKKGDVLLSNDKTTEVMFNGWYDDSYTSFYAKHYLEETDKSDIKYLEGLICTTDRYVTEAKVTAQGYINTIEERLGGKLNLETLEVERKPKWIPKPFDKVIYQYEEGNMWTPGFFAYKDETNCHFVIGEKYNVYSVLPYNEQTAHLIGTNESWEG